MLHMGTNDNVMGRGVIIANNTAARSRWALATAHHPVALLVSITLLAAGALRLLATHTGQQPCFFVSLCAAAPLFYGLVQQMLKEEVATANA